MLITGHTGFKGSWLALWLNSLGAELCGTSLRDVSNPSHWQTLEIQLKDQAVDIRNLHTLQSAINEFQPEAIFHLAAQSLVRKSYRDPLETWTTNVIGTANVLEACRNCSSVKAVVVVTTDKCYRNAESVSGYRESDSLGGHDPYSASKAAAELLVASYRQSVLPPSQGKLIATARAGNVVGGGDWAEDRLIPDAARAVAAGRSLEIRSPSAIRPWQHVLDSLSGYLLLGQQLLEGRAECADAWNFGPASSDVHSVSDVLNATMGHWPHLKWHLSNGSHPHETTCLSLDTTKAEKELGWRAVWSFEKVIQQTAQWYQTYSESRRVLSKQQIDDYVSDAVAARLVWAS